MWQALAGGGPTYLCCIPSHPKPYSLSRLGGVTWAQLGWFLLRISQRAAVRPWSYLEGMCLAVDAGCQLRAQLELATGTPVHDRSCGHGFLGTWQLVSKSEQRPREPGEALLSFTEA